MVIWVQKEVISGSQLCFDLDKIYKALLIIFTPEHLETLSFLFEVDFSFMA